MSAPSNHNVYALLGISPLADATTIAQAIARHRQQHSLNPAILDKAETWLLNPDIRQRYDAQLKQQAPELFAPPPADMAVLSIAAETPRLGVLDDTIHDGRNDVRVEPDVYLEQDIYTRSYQRHNLLSKIVIYGGMATVILGIILVFAWPFLQNTVFAPSEWDKVEFRQNLVQQGWQEDVEGEYAYLEGQEYDMRLALVYEKNEVWPVLIGTACDMNPQGLCAVKMRVNTGGDVFQFDDTVGMGLRDNLPLSTRAERKDAVKALQNAHDIKVEFLSGGETVTVHFEP